MDTPLTSSISASNMASRTPFMKREKTLLCSKAPIRETSRISGASSSSITGDQTNYPKAIGSSPPADFVERETLTSPRRMVEDIVEVEDAGNNVTEAQPQETMNRDGNYEVTTTIEENKN